MRRLEQRRHPECLDRHASSITEPGLRTDRPVLAGATMLLKRKLHRELKDPWILSARDIPESTRVAQGDRGISSTATGVISIESHAIEHVKRFGTEL